jgi:hypothetical protein
MSYLPLSRFLKMDLSSYENLTKLKNKLTLDLRNEICPSAQIADSKAVLKYIEFMRDQIDFYGSINALLVDGLHRELFILVTASK